MSQFSNLIVGNDSFSVDLAFGGVTSTITIPYTALKVFADPSVQFALSFEPTEPVHKKEETYSAEIIDLTNLRRKK